MSLNNIDGALRWQFYWSSKLDRERQDVSFRVSSAPGPPARTLRIRPVARINTVSLITRSNNPLICPPPASRLIEIVNPKQQRRAADPSERVKREEATRRGANKYYRYYRLRRRGVGHFSLVDLIEIRGEIRFVRNETKRILFFIG